VNRFIRRFSIVGVAAIVAVLSALSASTSRVTAQELPQTQPTPIAQYARALRYFNKSLSQNSSQQLALHVVRDAYVHSLDPRLLVALVAVESSWRPQAVSRAGARGLGQLMPSTARLLGVNPAEPFSNLSGTATYLESLLNRFAFYDSQTQLEYAVAAYNAGPKAIVRYHGLPPFAETQHYVRKVLSLLHELSDPTRLASKVPLLPSVAAPAPAAAHVSSPDETMWGADSQ